MRKDISLTYQREQSHHFDKVFIINNIWMICQSSDNIRHYLDVKLHDIFIAHQVQNFIKDICCYFLQIWQLFLFEVTVGTEIPEIALTFSDSNFRSANSSKITMYRACAKLRLSIWPRRWLKNLQYNIGSEQNVCYIICNVECLNVANHFSIVL